MNKTRISRLQRPRKLVAQRKLSHLLEREDFQKLKYEINCPTDSKSSHKMSPRGTANGHHVGLGVLNLGDISFRPQELCTEPGP